MGQITILGSGYAVPEAGHDNTHFFIQQGSHGVLVDCGSNPIVRLQEAGIRLDQISDVILTHFHPDHVSGLPLLLMDLWLLGRKSPLHVYGLPHTLDRAQAMMNLYDWRKWPGFFQVIYNRVPEQEMSLIISKPDLKIYSSPVRHLIPTIGLRVEFTPQEKVLAYSCDTEPCPEVARLAAKANILIHETAGSGTGHSTAEQAAQTARQAAVEQLVMIHYSAQRSAELLAAAQAIFNGPVKLAEDMMRLDM